MSPTDLYSRLELRFYDLRNQGGFEEALTILHSMATILTTYPSQFDMTEDRLTLLRCREIELSIAQLRSIGDQRWRDAVTSLLTASTPKQCVGMPCADFSSPACVARKPGLTNLERDMCIRKVSWKSRLLHIEGSVAAKQMRYRDALSCRRQAHAAARDLLLLAPSPQHDMHLKYIAYWHYITEMYVCLYGGDFAEAREWTAKAQAEARMLDQRTCFPNYFRSLSELAAQTIFTDGVEAFRSGRFEGARDCFQQWLDLQVDAPSSARKSNVQQLCEICSVVQRFSRRCATRDDWSHIEQLLHSGYTSRVTWALWDRLKLLRAHTDSQSEVTAEHAEQLVRMISENWKLALLDAHLPFGSHGTGIQRHVEVPTFLDILSRIDHRTHNWQQLIWQNVRHLFILMAEHEEERAARPIRGHEEFLPEIPKSARTTAKDSIPILIERIRAYLYRRSASHWRVFNEGILLLQPLKLAISKKDFTEAIRVHAALLDKIRFWPHVIKVVECTENAISALSKPYGLRAFTVSAERLWLREPRQIVMKYCERLKVNEFYLLSPRWNTRLAESYQVRHEPVWRSRHAKWINTFAENIVGDGKVERLRFHDWILQFPPSERLLACRLVFGLQVLDAARMRAAFNIALARLPHSARINTAFVGFGKGGKSGQVASYLVRQAASSAEYFKSFFGVKNPQVYSELAEFEACEEEVSACTNIVFVDDFIGSGQQATRFLKQFFEEKAWLKQKAVHLCALVGFSDGIRTVRDGCGELHEVVVGEEFGQEKRAFSPENPLWESVQEAKDAEEWAKCIGKQLLESSRRELKYDPERDALGWRDCQALITFEYNTPNDTVSLLWAHGQVRGKPWNPLCIRVE